MFIIFFSLFFCFQVYAMDSQVAIEDAEYVIISAEIELARVIEEHDASQLLTLIKQNKNIDLSKKIAIHEIHDLTPLEFALKCESQGCLDILRANKAPITSFALQLAIFRRNEPLVRSFLKTKTVNLEEKSEESSLTSLELAVKQNYLTAVDLLRQHGAQITDCAMQLSLSTKNSSMVQYLLKNGGEVTAQLMEMAVMGMEIFCINLLLDNGGKKFVTQSMVDAANERLQLSRDLSGRDAAQFMLKQLNPCVVNVTSTKRVAGGSKGKGRT